MRSNHSFIALSQDYWCRTMVILWRPYCTLHLGLIALVWPKKIKEITEYAIYTTKQPHTFSLLINERIKRLFCVVFACLAVSAQLQFVHSAEISRRSKRHWGTSAESHSSQQCWSSFRSSWPPPDLRSMKSGASWEEKYNSYFQRVPALFRLPGVGKDIFFRLVALMLIWSLKAENSSTVSATIDLDL